MATITITVCDLTHEEGDVAKTRIMVGDRMVVEMELGPNGAKMVEEAVRDAIASLVGGADRGVQQFARTQPQPDDDEGDEEPAGIGTVRGSTELDDAEREVCRAWGQGLTPGAMRRLNIKPPAARGKLARSLVQAWAEAGRPPARG